MRACRPFGLARAERSAGGGLSAGANTKGVGFIGVRTFVEERFGDSGWAAIRGHFSIVDRSVLDGVLPGCCDGLVTATIACGSLGRTL